jgi:ADP-ribosyl-[dinitrogen reductase] hydrolase
MEDKIVGSLVGLACGDAVGTALEFKQRGSFEPITDMIGGGPFNLERGQWTDDTSMALCLAHSLLHSKGFDPVDQMNRYCKWYQYGYMSSNGKCFDIGVTVSKALKTFMETKNPYSGPTDTYSSGNGSLMRLAPIPIFYHKDINICMKYAGDSSRTTHGSIECIESCKLFSLLIVRAFSATTKNEIFEELGHTPNCNGLKPVVDGSFMDFSYEQINGSGYVIDSLLSALWCFYHGRDFRQAILLAANIGNDADTTAAICGQITGAFYGFSGIPVDWRESITMAGEIKQLAIDLYREGR